MYAVVRLTQHVSRLNTTIHNILSTALQLSISQKALVTLPEDGNVVSKHVGATILGILIFKGFTARHLYKSFGVKGLIVPLTNAKSTFYFA
jgi:hypothetical protein